MPSSDTQAEESARKHPWLFYPGASSARVWNVLLGGKSNFAADREVYDQVLEILAGFGQAALASAAFRVFAVEQLVAAGVKQFIDCGPGLLHDGMMTHEVAQRLDGAVRVLYVDKDEMVLANARALLAVNDETRVVEADIFDPKRLLALGEVESFLDLSRPVALVHTMTLGHCPSDLDPAEVLSTYMDSLAAGSYSVISHCITPAGHEDLADQIQHQLSPASFGDRWFRPLAEVQSLLAGQHLVRPGVATAAAWVGDSDPPEFSHQLVAAGIGCTAARPAKQLSAQLDQYWALKGRRPSQS